MRRITERGAPRAGILESGIYVDALNCTKAFLTYESHVVFALRFMIDTSIVGGNWVELPAGRFCLVPDADPQRLTHCQLEAHVHYSSLVSHEPEGAHPPCARACPHAGWSSAYMYGHRRAAALCAVAAAADRQRYRDPNACACTALKEADLLPRSADGSAMPLASGPLSWVTAHKGRARVAAAEPQSCGMQHRSQ